MKFLLMEKGKEANVREVAYIIAFFLLFLTLSCLWSTHGEMLIKHFMFYQTVQGT